MTDPANEPYFRAQLSRDTAISRVNKVVIETIEPLVLTQSDPSSLPRWIPGRIVQVLDFADLEVYGRDVTIYGPIVATGRIICIVAWTVVSMQSEKGWACINVNGKPGAPPPEARKQGQPKPGDLNNVASKVAKGKDGAPGQGAEVVGGGRPVAARGERTERTARRRRRQGWRWRQS
jgi:hypothetical protein